MKHARISLGILLLVAVALGCGKYGKPSRTVETPARSAGIDPAHDAHTGTQAETQAETQEDEHKSSKP